MVMTVPLGEKKSRFHHKDTKDTKKKDKVEIYPLS
jgi:hypothetical protein